MLKKSHVEQVKISAIIDFPVIAEAQMNDAILQTDLGSFLSSNQCLDLRQETKGTYIPIDFYKEVFPAVFDLTHIVIRTMNWLLTTTYFWSSMNN